jgi:hypothetical protein
MRTRPVFHFFAEEYQNIDFYPQKHDFFDAIEAEQGAYRHNLLQGALHIRH